MTHELRGFAVLATQEGASKEVEQQSEEEPRSPLIEALSKYFESKQKCEEAILSNRQVREDGSLVEV